MGCRAGSDLDPPAIASEDIRRIGTLPHRHQDALGVEFDLVRRILSVCKGDAGWRASGGLGGRVAGPDRDATGPCLSLQSRQSAGAAPADDLRHRAVISQEKGLIESDIPSAHYQDSLAAPLSRIESSRRDERAGLPQGPQRIGDLVPLSRGQDHRPSRERPSGGESERPGVASQERFDAVAQDPQSQTFRLGRHSPRQIGSGTGCNPRVVFHAPPGPHRSARLLGFHYEGPQALPARLYKR